jgi:hypothetical protein
MRKRSRAKVDHLQDTGSEDAKYRTCILCSLFRYKKPGAEVCVLGYVRRIRLGTGHLTGYPVMLSLTSMSWLRCDVHTAGELHHTVALSVFTRLYNQQSILCFHTPPQTPTPFRITPHFLTPPPRPIPTTLICSLSLWIRLW